MIITIFTVISALAAVAYTLVAFRTLKEIKAQRETAYRPDIIVDEKFFYIYGFESGKGMFPTEYTYKKKDFEYMAKKSHVSSFGINLFNIGLASAKGVQIEYSFELDKIVEIINEQNKKLPQNKIITIQRSKLFIEFKAASDSAGGSSMHSVNNQLKNNINHMLPVNISKAPVKIFLPSYVLELHSILIYNLWLDNSVQKEIPSLPIINLKIGYLDIGNKKHNKEYELSISYFGGTLVESMNSFKVKEKNDSLSTI